MRHKQLDEEVDIDIEPQRHQRQVQITKFDLQITLVSDHPYEDMEYLTDKAIIMFNMYDKKNVDTYIK